MKPNFYYKDNNMELILKKDVQNVGFKDDLVTVKNGYGRNFYSTRTCAFSNIFCKESISWKLETKST
jgi:ribosomal protein L9